MALLAYQFPNSKPIIRRGEWQQSTIKNLPDNHFFVTTFKKDKLYFFNPSKEIEKWEDSELTLYDDSSVFIANGKAYMNGLQWFIDGFPTHNIDKAVYSRIKGVDKTSKSTFQLFNKLIERYGNEALIYVMSDEKLGTWIGATPEVLLSGTHKELHSMALAGTKNNNSTKWSNKEIKEQNYVSDFIASTIQQFQPEKFIISPTETVKKGEVFHLQTSYTFQLLPTKWNDLMNALHPTPAVGGSPNEDAVPYILSQEPHNRAFYTGIIGWRGSKTISTYVNLRCMQVLKSQYALYVGGGITKDSDIGSEFQETEDKSETLLSIIYP